MTSGWSPHKLAIEGSRLKAVLTEQGRKLNGLGQSVQIWLETKGTTKEVTELKQYVQHIILQIKYGRKKTTKVRWTKKLWQWRAKDLYEQET